MVESIFECGICFKPYNHNEKKPLTLPCGHSFCYECIRKLNQHGVIKCPYDKRQHSVQPEALPVNYQVLTGLPMISAAPAQPESQGPDRGDAAPTANIAYCGTHPSKKVKFYCLNDKEMFCSKCILKHTQQKHEVINCSHKSKCSNSNHPMSSRRHEAPRH